MAPSSDCSPKGPANTYRQRYTPLHQNVTNMFAHIMPSVSRHRLCIGSECSPILEIEGAIMTFPDFHVTSCILSLFCHRNHSHTVHPTTEWASWPVVIWRRAGNPNPGHTSTQDCNAEGVVP